MSVVGTEHTLHIVKLHLKSPENSKIRKVNLEALLSMGITNKM